MTDNPSLSNLLHEERHFDPPEELATHANVTAEAYDEADDDRLAFWAKQAERITWAEPFTEVLDWSNPPFAKWFVGGKLNASYNCLDRHLEAGKGDKVAFHFEGEPGDTRTITYADLTGEVCQAANALTELGVETGDRVAIYMPMIPETVVAMLACARIGAPHTVVFGGFSSQALEDRIQDCDARIVITADGGYRRGAPAALKPAVDEALEKCPDVRNVLVVRRTGQDVEWTDDRDLWWHDVRRQAERRAHLRGVRRRAPALRDVHQRHDRQAKGHPAHHRRLHGWHVLHPLGDLRPQGRHRRLLVGGRHRLGHRPLLHRLRAARQRHDVGDVRRHSRHPAQGPLVGDHPEVQGQHPLLRADRDPDVHEVGSRGPREVRPVHRCG